MLFECLVLFEKIIHFARLGVIFEKKVHFLKVLLNMPQIIYKYFLRKGSIFSI